MSGRPRHGHCRRGSKWSKVYQAWISMVARCTNPRKRDYHSYGGRGITVCPRWRAFENFLADVGEPTPGQSLDRFPDVNGNYEPGNVRWATPAEQAHNRRTNTLTVDMVRDIRARHEQGESRHSIADAIGVPYSVVSHVVARRRWADVP